MDSDFLGIGNTEDSFLTSPVTDLSSSTAPDLGFDTDYRDLDSVAQVDLSTDGGATWKMASSGMPNVVRQRLDDVDFAKDGTLYASSHHGIYALSTA